MTEVNTIKAIIADDELLARNVIKKYLEDITEIEVVAECENGLQTLKQMPLIVFTTAFNQYAIKAFEVNAVDYLLKPFDKERFNIAVHKIMELRNSISFFEQKINRLQQSFNEYINTDKKPTNRILIKGNDAYSFINTSEVLWFEAFSDYVKIHTAVKTYLKNLSLNELENKLDPRHFVRIHRSTIININFIKEMKPYFNGEYFIFLSNGEKLKLSRSYKDKIKFLINESF